MTMSDKPNKNGDVFKTEYMGTWVDGKPPACFGNPLGKQHASCARCDHLRSCYEETDRRLGPFAARAPTDLSVPIKLLDDDPPTTFEHRIVKHRSKPCVDPWPILEQHGHGIRPGEFMVLGGKRTAARTVVACDPCVPDSERTVVTVGDALPDGQFNVRFQMEVTDEQLEFMKKTVGQKTVQGAASDMAELSIVRDFEQLTREIAAGLGVPKDMLFPPVAPHAPHPLQVYEELLKEKQAEYRRSLVGNFLDQFPAMKEAKMNKDNVLKCMKSNTNFPVKKGEAYAISSPEYVGKMPVNELDSIKVESFVLYRAEVLPKRDDQNELLRAEANEVRSGSSHMVAVTVVSPPHMPPGTMLRLVPYYGARPVSPPSQLLQKLADCVGLPIDGYATWEGVVGFVTEAVAKLKADNKRILQRSAEFEAAAQRERHRANQAADAAGGAASELARERRSFALTVAEMQLELRRLRKKAGER
jgi:hypothetical protein